jgi:hypothetical protein
MSMRRLKNATVLPAMTDRPYASNNHATSGRILRMQWKIGNGQLN